MLIDQNIIQRLLENDKTLKELDLSRNEIDNADLRELDLALQNNTSLTSLNLRSNQIDDLGARILANVLQKNKSLLKLDLGVNDIGNKGVRAICLTLKENSTLEWLNLMNNEVDNSGAKELSIMLKKNGTLLYLDLSFNLIGYDGVVKIALALRENVAIIDLKLSGNEQSSESVALITNHYLENYSVLDSDEGFSIHTTEDLIRKHAIADCVKLLMHLTKEDYLLCNHEQITSQLFNFESLLKMKTYSLPEQHFVKEIYRLLCAFSHYSGFNPESALTLLIEPFSDPRLSKVADALYAQSLLMSNLIYSKNVKHIKIRYTLLAYTARHERNSYAFAIGISGIANPNPRHIAIDDVRRVKTNTYNLPNQAYCISYDELLCLAKHALQSALSTEMELLATVIQQQDYCPITVGVLFQSTLFIDVLKEKYPNSTTFQCLEDYLSLKQIEGFGGVYSIDASKEKETKCERAILTSYQDALKTQSQQHLSVTSNITILKQQLLTTFTRGFGIMCRHSIFKGMPSKNTNTNPEVKIRSHSIG